MEGTFFSLLPTIIAVAVALISKEVYISLIAGILTGAVIIAHSPVDALGVMVDTMAQKIGSNGNTCILIFIIELGLLVAIMHRSGGTEAMSYFLTRRLRSKRSAMLTAAELGCTLFIDDYFNRLAVGTIMKPAFDKLDISRIKLAQIVCGVSVSVCILVPISSWASAIVAGISEGMDRGFDAYIRTLGCNFYPIFTLAFLFIGPFLSPKGSANSIPCEKEKPNGKAFDLVLPILVLILSSLLLMTKFESEKALAMGGAIAIVFCLLLYLPRKVMGLKDFTRSFTDGLKSTADIVMILVLAWTLTGICEKLDIGAFIGRLTASMGSAKALLPAIMFLFAMGTAFATGTAWGTFGILVPLAVPMFEPFSALQILTISAVLSGSVFGNQVSPISDSTLLASNLSECDHVEFIRSQLPTCLAIAFVSFVGFFSAGISGTIWVGWLSSLIAFAAMIILLNLKRMGRRHPKLSITPIKK